MRYIVDSNNRVLAVNFGSIIQYTDCGCTEYTGRVPSGWNSLEEWHDDEGEKLWRWKIVGGHLTLDSSAVAPEEGRWGVPKLQEKTVTGPLFTQTTVKPDADFDGLSSVVVAAQPYWKEMVESETYVSGGGTSLVISTPAVGGRDPKAILVNYSETKINALPQWTTTNAFFILSDGDLTYTHAHVIDSGAKSFELLGGYTLTSGLGYIEINSKELYTFYNSSPSRYKCYLMY